MRAPRVSQPREVALAPFSAAVEHHSVRGGGLTLLFLNPDDRLWVTDPQGRQPCEIAAYDAQGRCALAVLGLTAQRAATFIDQRLAQPDHQATRIAAQLKGRQPGSAARTWAADGPAGMQWSTRFSAPAWVVVAAPGHHASVLSQEGATDLAVRIERSHATAGAAVPLPPPLADAFEEFTVKAGTAHSFTLGAGEYVQIIDVAGRQCSDFVALDRRALDRGVERDLDLTATRTLNGHAYPAPGLYSKFYDRELQAMLEVVQDTVGRHDSFSLACTRRYYESLGYFGHDNCSQNINLALQAFGVQPRAGWPAINFFFNTQVDQHLQMLLDEPWSRPGDHVLLKAGTDLVCTATACPDDIDPANGWNPTDIHVRLYRAKERFSLAMAHRESATAPPVMTRESAFHARTSALTRHLVDYRGFWLPTRYGQHGPLAEYHACREKVAVMDLSALRKFEVLGPDAQALMQYCLTRDISRLDVGQVVYSAMCYPHGGMLDDGTLLRLGPDNFRWICGDDYSGIWFREQAERLGMKVWIKNATERIANLAVQGPLSRTLLQTMIWAAPTQPALAELGWFRFLVGRLGGPEGCPLMVSRTGYTGELGYEIWCHPKDAEQLWDRLFELGAPMGLLPLGLEALDLLRIEAGLVFAGYEFDDHTDPFEAGIGFTVPLKSKADDFLGREALLSRQAHPRHRLVGLELDGNEQAQHGDEVYVGRARIGVVTSGCRSAILGKNIALCRIDIAHSGLGNEVEVGRLDGLQKRVRAKVASAVAYDPDKARVRA